MKGKGNVTVQGDLEISDNFVRFSGNVGTFVTPEQRSILARTADRLGKEAVYNRIPSDPVGRDFYDSITGSYTRFEKSITNEHGVPTKYTMDQMFRK